MREQTTDQIPLDVLAETELDKPSVSSPAEVRAITTKDHKTVQTQSLRQIAEYDPAYQKLKPYIVDGFYTHLQQLPDNCKWYWSVPTHLTIEDDLILYGCHLLIPAQIKCQILQQLHALHESTALMLVNST